MTGIYWIASYPRSGNTWLRLMLQSCLEDGAPVSINSLWLGRIYAQSRPWFDEAIGVPAADLTASEMFAWRSAALRDQVARRGRPLYAKTHDARVRLPNGEMLIPPDVTLGAVYLVRDPRDVALSLSRYLNCTVDDAIEIMGKADAQMGRCETQLLCQLPGYLSSWSLNAQSWLAESPFPLAVMRYEDLRADPGSALAGILLNLGVKPVDAVVRAAVETTRLEAFQAQEKVSGFRDNFGHGRFFGDGMAGGWRSQLTRQQAARLEADHGAVMRRLGYL